MCHSNIAQNYWPNIEPAAFPLTDSPLLGITKLLISILLKLIYQHDNTVGTRGGDERTRDTLRGSRFYKALNQQEQGHPNGGVR
jgi:hypothetical protein